MYSKEEVLEIYGRIGVTEEAYKLLKNEKKRLNKIGERKSMAKLTTELILEKYGRI